MKSFNYIVTCLLAVAVVYILIDNLYLDKRAMQTGPVSLPRTSASEEATIAVLPFANLSSDPEQEYFVDGLTEEILNQLAKMQELLVVSRTSSFEFRGSNKTLQEIANALGVEYIIEGSVRKTGNALRITAELIHPTDGLHLWSKTYDRELRDIFALQRDIASSVADELKITLGIEKPISMVEAELVRETERTRLKALVEGNMEVARQLHADDFQLINPDGTAKTKEQYLGGLASGEADYLIWEPKTIVVRMYGDAAVIRYQSKIQIVIQGVDSGLNSLWHTDLYEKHDGQWQIVWSHANLIQ